jgi:hypothetical protein
MKKILSCLVLLCFTNHSWAQSSFFRSYVAYGFGTARTPGTPLEINSSLYAVSSDQNSIEFSKHDKNGNLIFVKELDPAYGGELNSALVINNQIYVSNSYSNNYILRIDTLGNIVAAIKDAQVYKKYLNKIANNGIISTSVVKDSILVERLDTNLNSIWKKQYHFQDTGYIDNANGSFIACTTEDTNTVIMQLKFYQYKLNTVWITPLTNDGHVRIMKINQNGDVLNSKIYKSIDKPNSVLSIMHYNSLFELNDNSLLISSGFVVGNAASDFGSVMKIDTGLNIIYNKDYDGSALNFIKEDINGNLTALRNSLLGDLGTWYQCPTNLFKFDSSFSIIKSEQLEDTFTHAPYNMHGVIASDNDELYFTGSSDDCAYLLKLDSNWSNTCRNKNGGDLSFTTKNWYTLPAAVDTLSVPATTTWATPNPSMPSFLDTCNCTSVPIVNFCVYKVGNKIYAINKSLGNEMNFTWDHNGLTSNDTNAIFTYNPNYNYISLTVSNNCYTKYLSNNNLYLDHTKSKYDSFYVCKGSNFTLPNGVVINNIQHDTAILYKIKYDAQSYACNDSFFFYIIKARNTVKDTINSNICIGNIIAGVTITKDTNFTVNNVSQFGCPADTFYSITAIYPTITNANIIVCPTCGWTSPSGITYSAPLQNIIIKDTIPASNNCYNINTYSFTYCNAVLDSVTYKLCPGLSYTSAKGITYPYSPNGYTIYELFSTPNLCDSTLKQIVQYYPYDSSSVTLNICVGDSFKNIIIQNDTSLTLGYLNQTTNCDSIVTYLIDAVPTPIPSFDTIIVCTACNWTSPLGNMVIVPPNGVSVPITYTTAWGCDSLANYFVRKCIPSVDTLAYKLCYGATYTSIKGVVYPYTPSILYITDTLLNATQCDSIIVQLVTFDSSIGSIITPTICYGKTYTGVTGNTYTITSSVTINDTLMASNGCDSVVIQNILVLPSVTTTIASNACKGDIYTTASGTSFPLLKDTIIVDSFQDINGCDSLLSDDVDVIELDTSVTTAGNIFTAQANLNNSFQWYDCSTQQIILNATNQSFTPQISGSYAVIIGFQNCYDTSTCITYVNTSISNDIINNDFIISSANIKYLGQSAILDSRLYNISGQLIETEIMNKEINIATLADGLYLLKISLSNKQVVMLKFVKW